MIHLHNHSYYSTLDGLASPEEMILRAKELGQSAIAVTDHASMSALPEMIKYGKEHGVKPIIGCEFYIVHDDDEFFGKKKETRLHFIAIAKNWEGVKCLFRKLTLANQQKFNGRPRLFYSQLFDFNDCFVSLACAISLMTRPDYEDIALKFKKEYGNYFYLEIIHASFKMKDKRPKKEIEKDPWEMPDQAKLVNLRCVEMHLKHNIPLVATHDAHYATKDQAKAFEVLLCIQTRSKMSEKTFDEGGRRFFFGDNDIYIKSEMEVFLTLKKLGYIPEEIIKKAIRNTDIVASHCDIVMPEFSFNLPKPYENEDDREVFHRKIKEGFYKFGFDKVENRKEYMDRISHEVRVIEKLDLIRYFLIVEDLMRFCRQENIGVGSARGSAGGSLVALCLGVTRRIDPIKYGLYFERFLNEDRVSMADIDMDISSSRREEVIQYLRDKYGHDKVAQIATYGYLSAKSAFRDVCSCYSFPSGETNRLSKLIEDGFIEEDGKKIGKYDRAESFDHVPELKAFKLNHPKLVELILMLDGRIRNAGVHAAGVITSSIPLQDLGVIESRTGGECVCWDKKVSEDTFCLLKLDCLGLKTVDVNTKACELVSKKLGKEFTTDHIPLTDFDAEQMLSEGDSVAIFQFEGGNARRLLKDGQKGNLEACAAISAVNRPGALNAKDAEGVNITTHYIKRLNGSEQPEYFIPQFRTVLAETYGLMIYQEDMMRICTDIAGFSGSEADTFRKIVGKKLSKEEFEKHREEFVVGCISHSRITRDEGDKIFDDILEMAAYSFNKSHSVGYAILSMESAWLKKHHPVEYYCGVLSFAGKDDKFQEYIRDSNRHNAEVCYPDINHSNAMGFIIHEGKIMAPLNSIKGVGDVAAAYIEAARRSTELGRFDNHEHFLGVLTTLKINGKVNKRIKDILFRANVFKEVGHFVEDKQERRNNLRELLGLFSPTPSINFKSGRSRDKKEYMDLMSTIQKCSRGSGNGSFVEPISFARSSVLVVLDLSKQDTKLLNGDNTKWFQNHLMNRLGVSRSAISFTSVMKCSFYNVEKNAIDQECKTMCSREFLSREIGIMRPRLIINCVSWLTAWMIEDPKAKFQETFGNSYFSGKFDAYVMNVPSPQWVSYDDIIRDRYNKEIIPLLESMKGDQV